MAVNQLRKMSPQDESLWFKLRVELKINVETESFYRDLKIGVDRGTVVLEGSAPSEEAARAAERVALRVQGVFRVVNNLKIA